MLYLLIVLLCCHTAFTLPAGYDKRIDAALHASYQVDSTLLQGPMTPLYSAVPIASRLWPGGRVPYRTTSNTDVVMENVLKAMEKIQGRTCIRFVEAEPEDRDYINITLKEGCWSHVGRARGVQELSLGLPCGESQGVILHELLHAMGFWHEHARSDRDDFVDVHWDNIQEGEKRNFQKLQPWENNLLDEAFDYDSVMMYGGLAFSKDGVSQTLTSRTSRKRILDLSEKTDLSAADIRKINKLYECNGEKRPTPSEVPVMECNFHNDYCGFTSQGGQSLQEWTLADTKEGGLSLSWHDGPFTAGRLFSPYLKPYHRDEGCVYFLYRFEGDAMKGLRVSRQTELEEEHLLYESPAQFGSADEWLEVALEVPLDQEFKLVFEGVIVSGTRDDVITVDDLLFQWKPCT